MAYSLQQVTSDGTLDYLALSFEYTDRATIHVYYDGVENTTNWAWAGPTETAITFTPAVPDGVEVLVRRISPLSSVQHIFGYRGDGSGNAAFTADSMDDNFQQTLEIAQEVTDVNDLTADYAASAKADALAAAASAAAAAASASGADASEAAALASQNAAALSASAANTSKLAAELAETNAETAEVNAELAEVNAEAAQAAAEAAKLAAEAAETNAIAQAAAALVSKNAAATSASNALISESNASASAVSALNTFNTFRGLYYGPLSADPVSDPLGNAVQVGDLYLNTVANVMRVFTGSIWEAAYVSLSGALLASNNLSDVANAETARSNIGAASTGKAIAMAIVFGGG